VHNFESECLQFPLAIILQLETIIILSILKIQTYAFGVIYSRTQKSDL